MVKVIVSVMVLFFVVGCSSVSQEDGPGRQYSPTDPSSLNYDGAGRAELSREIRETAWKAYAEATGLNILAEEGPVGGDEFILSRDVEGLGKKGEKICEVRFAILGGPETRGLVLVNEKTRQSLVVFPKKRESTASGTGG